VDLVQTPPAAPGAPVDLASWVPAIDAVLAGAGPDLVAQPIIDLGTAQIVGYELLSRFTGPPTATPDVWFLWADRCGHGAALTARVLIAALAARATLPANTFLSVNIEPHLFTAGPVQEVLARAPDLNRLVLELTEHVEPADPQALMWALGRARAAGAMIAIDDAGTGYAGLEQLLTIRPDIVKLDRVLVAGLHHDPIRRGLVELMGDLAGRMDAWLLAEGVEEPDELATLTALGVPLAQGYLLGRPAPLWAPLAQATRTLIQTTSARTSLEGNVVALMHTCLVRDRDATDAPVGTVLVDAAGRPEAVVIPGPGGVLAVVPAMTVAPTSDSADVLRRAVARPSWLQAAPIVCTDGFGQPIGVIELADLVDAVLRTNAPL